MGHHHSKQSDQNIEIKTSANTIITLNSEVLQKVHDLVEVKHHEFQVAELVARNKKYCEDLMQYCTDHDMLNNGGDIYDNTVRNVYKRRMNMVGRDLHYGGNYVDKTRDYFTIFQNNPNLLVWVDVTANGLYIVNLETNKIIAYNEKIWIFKMHGVQTFQDEVILMGVVDLNMEHLLLRKTKYHQEMLDSDFADIHGKPYDQLEYGQ